VRSLVTNVVRRHVDVPRTSVAKLSGYVLRAERVLCRGREGWADGWTVGTTALAATRPRTTMRIVVIVGIFLVLDVIVLVLYRVTHRR
jgi:hypothetical protein